MAGHSKFKNIMHRKGAQDAKKAKIFTRLAKEIIIAAKLAGPDPNANPRLKTAIVKAKASNMPKDKIDNALSRAVNPANTDNYEEVRYEGYAAKGVAIIIETLTDNKNRTASEVRAILNKHGGVLGEPGSVSFMFSRIGLIEYDNSVAEFDKVLEAAIEAGAQDCEVEEDKYSITSAPEDLHQVEQTLAEKFGTAVESKLTWQPNMHVEGNDEVHEKIAKLVNVLYENEDVQEVIVNLK